MTTLRTIAGILICSLALGGCNPSSKPEEKPPPVRPVLSILVSPSANERTSFAGSIKPQVETQLGFQVLGRIVSRAVDVGDRVKRGQVLASLDPLTFNLALRSSEADLAKANSAVANAAAVEQRQKTLLDKQVVSQSDYDAAQQARAAAAASVEQAQAKLEQAREALTYTNLTADYDGVVTATSAEVGQTVSAGQTVLTVARTDLREAVVDIPEDLALSLSAGAPFEIELQSDTSVKVTGKVREIAPQADASTRTRRTKITLDEIVEGFRLGATITANPKRKADIGGFEIPASAVLERDGKTMVWLVDTGTKTVRTTEVELVERRAHSARVVNGLSKGSRVVIAGVHSLTEGQSVKIDESTAQ